MEDDLHPQDLTQWFLKAIEDDPAQTVPPEQRLAGQNLTLDQWLHAFLNEPSRLHDLSRYCFPSEQHLEEFIQRIDEFPPDFIYRILFKLLPRSCSFPLNDKLNAMSIQRMIEARDPHIFDLLQKVNYIRACFMSAHDDESYQTVEGCSWVIGLLPDNAKETLAALSAYGLAHLAFFPDGVISAFFNAQEIIRAKFVGVPQTHDEYLNVLKGLTSREFEHLTEALYHELGYETELTAPSGDGGRDVVARKSQPHESELIVIECKQYFEQKVGIAIIQRLHGVAAKLGATKAVLVTTATLTEPALTEVEEVQILNYLDGTRLIEKLTEAFGPRWPLTLSEILLKSQRRDEERRRPPESR